MSLDIDTERLAEFYGAKRAQEIEVQLQRLAPYMTNPATSLRELTDPKFYKRRGISLKTAKEILQSSDVPRILREYADIVKQNASTRKVTVNPRDISDVIKLDVPDLAESRHVVEGR